MTPATLARLAGQLHHLPDARDLRIVDADGTAHDLPWQAVEVYEAAPMVLGLAEIGATLSGSVRDALRLPADTPWVDVLARARRLADLDPGRTLDDEAEVPRG